MKTVKFCEILWSINFFIKRDRVTDLRAVVRKNVENYSVLFKLTDCKISRTKVALQFMSEEHLQLHSFRNSRTDLMKDPKALHVFS